MGGLQPKPQAPIVDDAWQNFLEQPEVKAFIETGKEFLRWSISFLIGWIIDNGYSYIAKSKLDPQVITYIGVVFRAADFFWHKYNKERTTIEGKSMGIMRF